MSVPSIRLRKKPLGEIVKKLDAFPKIEKSIAERKRTTGGLILFLCAVITVWLVCEELRYYSNAHYAYKFHVDTEHSTKLQIDFDITVASPCDLISADVTDSTGQSFVYMQDGLKLDTAQFELNEVQAKYFARVRELQKRNFREPKKLDELFYLQEELFHIDEEDTSILKSFGCRIHGRVKVNKVAGNIHITAGKSFQLAGGGHAHLNFFGLSANFSHRIHKFSFGARSLTGLIDPLDAIEKLDSNERTMFQYYVQIVPTILFASDRTSVKTYQYSMTQRARVIEHEKGSHGTPGIYFKYDFSPVVVQIDQQKDSYVELLLRLCCIVGGMFATSGLINAAVFFLIGIFWPCDTSLTNRIQHDEEFVLYAKQKSSETPSQIL